MERQEVSVNDGMIFITGWNILLSPTKMYCFFCCIFAHKVMGPGNTGTIDPAFATNGTQAQRWKKKARSALSKHQSCFVHKQSALFHADFLNIFQLTFSWIKLLQKMFLGWKSSRNVIETFCIV